MGPALQPDRTRAFSLQVRLMTVTSRLKSQTKHFDPNILLVEDQSGFKFGAFASKKWALGPESFYGTGETFLFTFRKVSSINNFQRTTNYCRNSSGPARTIRSNTAPKRGSGSDLGEVCSPLISREEINSWGLYLNEALTGGFSAKSDTFANEMLSGESPFVVRSIEVRCAFVVLTFPC